MKAQIEFKVSYALYGHKGSNEELQAVDRRGDAFLAAAPPSVQQRSTSKAMAGWLAGWPALTMQDGRTDGRIGGEVGLDGAEA